LAFHEANLGTVVPSPGSGKSLRIPIGVDADLSLVQTVVGTAANVNDVTQNIKVNWHVAMRPGKRKALDKSMPLGEVMDLLEYAKASIRGKLKHPFRVIKRQFGHVKVHYRGLTRNTAQLHTLFALSNFWMVRRTLLEEARG
jgi:IS5 family transposase